MDLSNSVIPAFVGIQRSKQGVSLPKSGLWWFLDAGFRWSDGFVISYAIVLSIRGKAVNVLR